MGSDSGDENDNNLFHLATKVRPPVFAKPHQWPPASEGRVRVPAGRSYSGFEQIETTCPVCGLVRITVMHPVQPRRAYRLGDARYQFEEVVEPECVASGHVIACGGV